MEHGEPDYVPHYTDPRTFAGHISPGTVYFVYGCLWAYNTLFRYHVARRQAILRGSDSKKLLYKNALFSKYHSGCVQAAPFEALFLAVGGITGCILEITLYHEDLPLIEAVHHVIMFTFVSLSGMTELARHYKFAMPPSSEYAVFIVTSTVVAFLFSNHLSSKEIVDRQMHLLLVYVGAISILCTALELMHKKNVTLAVGRSLTLMVLGIWMCAIGIIAYPLPFMHAYNLNSHVLLGFVTALGVVVVAVALMIVFAMNFTVTRRVRNMNLATVNRILAVTHYQRVSSGSEEKAECPLISDSDYEM